MSHSSSRVEVWQFVLALIFYAIAGNGWGTAPLPHCPTAQVPHCPSHRLLPPLAATVTGVGAQPIIRHRTGADHVFLFGVDARDHDCRGFDSPAPIPLKMVEF